MKYPFRFKIQAYSYDDEKHYISTGMGICTSYADAASQLETYFGNALCSILNITLYSQDNFIFLSEEMCEDYEKRDFPEVEYSYDCTPEGDKIV